MNFVLLGLGIVIFLFLAAGIRIVRPIEKGLIERLGKYRKTAEQGFHWIIPFIDIIWKVNITENMVDVEPQKIITKDDLNATVDAVVYFRVLDPQKAKYKAENYRRQITSLARTTLRDIIGKMTLSEANSKRDELNTKLESELDKQTDAWGIDVIRVELQRIEPPEDVQEGMNRVVKAEREKKAAIDYATATETKADGERRAEIKKAEGVAKAIELKAEAKAKAIEKVNTAADKFFKGNAKDLKKLEVTQSSLQDNSKIILTEKGIKPIIVLGEQ